MNTDELLTAWHSQDIATAIPPVEDCLLWQGNSGSIYVANKWGPAIPYPPVQHANGEENHGYMKVKGNLQVLAHIPEL